MTIREPLYTEQDRAELLALGVYRDGLCPACGGPISECSAPEKTGPRYRAKYQLCQRRNALSIAQKVKDAEHPEAFMWWTEPTGR